jgi:SAM-dependent methyltransferase
LSSSSPTGFPGVAQLEQWHFWFVGRDELVKNLLDRHRAKPPFVDVGCGSGRFVAGLGGDQLAVGLDRTPPPPARQPGSGVLAADATRLPLRGGSTGTVLARDILEHTDDAAALAECHRILRPGGLLVALVPAWPSLWSVRDEDAGHRRRYSRGTLRHTLTGVGFTVVELRGYQLALLPAAIGSRLVARARGRAQLRTEERIPASLNRLLTGVNRAEARLARRAHPRPPTGSTLAVVARRP